MPEKYEVPEMEVVQFDMEDVIVTSSGLGEDELPIMPVN